MQLPLKRGWEVDSQETEAEEEARPSKRFKSASPDFLRGPKGQLESTEVEEKGWMSDNGD
jgi:hypothetical protein